MGKYYLPYGDSELELVLDDSKIKQTLILPKECKPILNPVEAIKEALAHPLNSRPLGEFVSPHDKVAIAIDDVTRKTPSRIMLPPVIEELSKAGVKDENVTVIIARGAHRLAREHEIPKIAGEEINRRFKIVNHDPESNLIEIGITSFDNRILINKTFHDADVRIVIGDVELHTFAGYGGGRKTILPGLSALETIKRNHSMVRDDRACMGNIEGNSIHLDMMEAASMIRVDLFLCAVLDGVQRFLSVYTGDMEEVFFKAVKDVDRLFKIPIPHKMDMVIISAGGYPGDINLYQSNKAIEMANSSVREDGVIVLVTECREGIGTGEGNFLDWMGMPYDDLEVQLRDNFQPGIQIPYLIRRSASHCKIIVVANPVIEEFAKTLTNIYYAPDLNSALEKAFSFVGNSPSAVVIPQGKTTMGIPA